MNVTQVMLDRLDFQAVVAYLDDVSSKVPETFELLTRRARALDSLGRSKEAIAVLTRAERMRPEAPECQLALGNLFQREGHPLDAIGRYRRVLAARPGLPVALQELGRCLAETGQFDEALSHARELIDTQPNNAEAFVIAGAALLGRGDAGEAVRAFQQAVYLRPRNSTDHVNLGRALLLEGSLEQGWLEMEWRVPPTSERSLRGDRWVGQSLKGKTILFLAEPALDATLKFLRFAKLAHEAGARVLLRGDESLRALLSECSFISEVVGSEADSSVDFWAMIGSAPIGFGTTRPSLIPIPIPYITVAQRESTVAEPPEVLRLVCCLTEPKWLVAVMNAITGRKNLDVQLTVLSSTHLGCERNSATALPDGVNLIEGITLAETAEIMARSDGTITSSAIAAHLAGALGRPLLAIQPRREQWQWSTSSAATPWFPSATLCWIPEELVNPSPAERVAEHLRTWITTLTRTGRT